MQIALKFKLDCDAPTRAALLVLIRDVNECANWVSAEAWLAQKFRRYDLHHLVYRRARACYDLRGQTVCVGVIAKVAAAYKSQRAERVAFRPLGSVEFHAKDLRITDRVAHIAMASGHVSARLLGRESDWWRLSAAHGQCRIQASGRSLYLVVPVSVEQPEATASSSLGVDLGIANIATDSEGTRYSGAALRGIRYRKRRLRAKLMSKGTRSARRRLKRMGRKEARFARDTNHVISKQLVATAERTNAAIALEDLSGIRQRARATRKAQRAELSSWSFFQLRQFVTYKAALAGVPVVLVNPKNTSRECSACGHIAKGNRKSQATFKCRVCGFTAHADYNAALNIRSRAAFSQPYATGEITHLVASLSG